MQRGLWAVILLAGTLLYATALPGILLHGLLPASPAVAAPGPAAEPPPAHPTPARPIPGAPVPVQPAPAEPAPEEPAPTPPAAGPAVPKTLEPQPLPQPEPPQAQEPPAVTPREPASASRPTVRVMAFNIRHGLGLDGQVSLERVAQAIAQGDIVFLSEVDRFWLRSGLRDQPAVLQELTGLPYAHFAPALDLPGPSRQYGNLLLSRYPILQAKTVPLPRRQGSEARVMIEARINVHGQVWTVYGVHLGLDQQERRQQVEAIQARAALGGPYRILLGDFNALPEAPELEPLRAPGPPAWIDGLADGPPTYPAWEPAARIDQIWLSPGLAGQQVAGGVAPTQASDHLPVWVELVLPGGL